MDERAWQEELTEMVNNHAEELRALKNREPRTNPNVVKSLIQNLTAKLTDAKDVLEINHILRQIKAISEEE